MKHFNTVLAGVMIAAAVAVVVGCNKQETPATPTTANAASAATPAGVTPYPLDKCVVSGEKLGGDMGTPVEFVYQGQQIKFCCAMCKPKFLKDPDTYMKTIKAAETNAATAKN